MIGAERNETPVPPLGAYVDGAEEFGKRGQDLTKTTTPLKSTGKYKYYPNNWQGNQYVKTKSVFNKNVMKGVSRGAGVLGGLLDAAEVYDGYKVDGGEFGYNTKKEAAGVVGSMGGAVAGGYIGGVIGTAIFPGAGSVVGGTVGSFFGSWGGRRSIGKRG